MNGKLSGKERSWNRQGLLVFECHYDADTPLGKCRSWHPNGLLEKEITYYSDGNFDQAAWDEKGHFLYHNLYHPSSWSEDFSEGVKERKKRLAMLKEQLRQHQKS